MPRKVTRFIAFLLCFCLLFEQTGFAQVAGQLDISGYFSRMQNSFASDKFRPLHLRYLSYNPELNNFRVLLDKGDSKELQEALLEGEGRELLKYFFVGISLPNDSFWVNLRPDTPESIIDDYVAKTDVGKVLLEADLELKKDTARFTSPQTLEGKEYWEKLYKKAGEIFGTENVSIPTLSRPWIVPDEIIIREAQDNAYIYKATLKVLLEEDYLRDGSQGGNLLTENRPYSFKDPRSKNLNEYAAQLMRELIMPRLTKEINTAKRYASLRQVYYSLILSHWFKEKFYGKGGLYSWLIDKRNLNGLTSQESWSKETYFKEYQKSFKEGEYNIQQPVSTPFGQTIRSYFSGGIAFGGGGAGAGSGIAGAIGAGRISSSAIELPEFLKRKTPSLTAKGGTLENPFQLSFGNIELIEPVSASPLRDKEPRHQAFLEINQEEKEGLEGEGKKIVDFLFEKHPEAFGEIIKNLGLNIRLGDILDKSVSYHASGSNKHVLKVELNTLSGKPMNFLAAIKTPRKESSLFEAGEREALIELRGTGLVPTLGGVLELSRGASGYGYKIQPSAGEDSITIEFEEFIDGYTITQIREFADKVLNSSKIRNVLKEHVNNGRQELSEQAQQDIRSLILSKGFNKAQAEEMLQLANTLLQFDQELKIISESGSNNQLISGSVSSKVATLMTRIFFALNDKDALEGRFPSDVHWSNIMLEKDTGRLVIVDLGNVITGPAKDFICELLYYYGADANQTAPVLETVTNMYSEEKQDALRAITIEFANQQRVRNAILRLFGEDGLGSYKGAGSLDSISKKISSNVRHYLESKMEEPASSGSPVEGRREAAADADKVEGYSVAELRRINRALKLAYGWIEDPEDSVFFNLYRETQEIFDRLCQHAQIEGASLYLLEDDELKAFAVPKFKIIALSTGVFKFLQKQGLTKDAIAFVLAHEIRHIMQREKLGYRDDISQKERFAQEIDADMVLEFMNKAGYNVLEAKKLFEILSILDKTDDLLGSIAEAVDEHPPLEKRIKYLGDKIRTANWLYTDTIRTFSKISEAELDNKTDLRLLFEELNNIKTFDALINLMERAVVYPEYTNTIVSHGVINIINALMEDRFADETKDTGYVQLGSKTFPRFQERDLRRSYLLSAMLDGGTIKNDSYFRDNELVRDIGNKLDRQSLDKAQVEFSQGYQGLLDYIAQRYGIFSRKMVTLLLERYALEKLGEATELDGFKSHTAEIIQYRITDFFFSDNKTIPQYIQEMQEFIITHLRFRTKKEGGRDTADRDLYEVSVKNYQEYFTLLWQRIIAAALQEHYHWASWEEIIRALYEKQRNSLVEYFSTVDWKVVRYNLLTTKELSVEEKVALILEFPQISAIYDGYTNREIDEEAAALLYQYYKDGGPKGKSVEDFLVKSFWLETNTNKTKIAKIISNEALDGLQNGNSALLDKFGFFKLEKSFFDLYRDMYRIWSRDKSATECFALLGKLTRYCYQNNSREIEKGPLDRELFNAIAGMSAEVLDEQVKDALKEAGISEGIDILQKGSKILICFFSKGGILGRDEFYDAIEAIKDEELEILARFLNSGYLFRIQEEEFNISRKDKDRTFSALLSTLGLTLNMEGKVLEQEEENVVRGFWANYILFLNLRIFFKQIGYGRDLRQKFTKLQFALKEFLVKQEKIRSGKDDSPFLYGHFSGSEAEANISQRYEPLFRELFNLPLYLDRTLFLEAEKLSFMELFDFIFDSSLTFDELLVAIHRYLPEGFFRNFILLALLSREVNKDYPNVSAFNLIALKKLAEEQAGIAEKIEAISPYLTSDARLILINATIFGYLQRKVNRSKNSGIGAEDGAGDMFGHMPIKYINILRLPSQNKGPLVFLFDLIKRIGATASHFVYRMDSIFISIVSLIKYSGSLVLSQYENKYLKEKFLKRAGSIFKERRIKNSLLSENNLKLLNSIVKNYYLEKLLAEIYTNNDLAFIRKIILKYLAFQRTKRGISKIDIFYFDFNHPQRLVQLDAVIPELLQKKIQEKIYSQESFGKKLSYICSLFANAQPTRDKYLVLLLEKELINPKSNVQDKLNSLKDAAGKFYNNYFRNQYLLKALELEHSVNPSMSLKEEVEAVKRYFPEAGYLRDDILKSILERVQTDEEYREVAKLFYGKKEHILEDKEKIEKVYTEEKIKLFFEKTSSEQKKDFVLWVLGIKDMPLFMKEYEELFGVSFESIKNIYSPARNPIYAYAGENARALFIEEMFLGNEGILQDERLFKEFMEEVFNFILRKADLGESISKGLLKKIYRTIIDSSDNAKRLEIVKSIAINFSSLLSENKSAEHSAYEIIPKFMESLGIIGVKVAQILAFSGDISIPEELRASLASLSSGADPLTKAVAFETLSNLNIKDRIKKIVKTLGGASIKVVFEAVTHKGDIIALKIKRPVVAHELEEDLAFFKRVCSLLRRRGVRVPDGFEHRASEGIRQDADFEKESKSTETLKAQLAEINAEKSYNLSSGEKVEFVVPEIYEIHEGKVIFSQKIEGKDLDKEEELIKNGILNSQELKELKKIVFDFLMAQLFGKGLYLSDPHGGNFRVAKEDGKIKIYLIDVGAVDAIQKSRDAYKTLLESLVFMQHGIRTSDEFIWAGMFFKKTGYLTKGLMNND
ncbi:MAG: AarF/UbiB family protein, partial [Candidatus Omnitrophota bacterium]